MPDQINGPQSASSTDVPLTSGPPRRERADAVRNRRRILDAAAELFAAHGVEQVSMDAIAAAAGVGKGTLFRRFGDRAGLAAALLHERETELQEGILRGEAPLGPGTGSGAALSGPGRRSEPGPAEAPEAQAGSGVPRSAAAGVPDAGTGAPGAADRQGSAAEPVEQAESAEAPGQAAPADRLEAFVRAYLDYAFANLELVRASETASPGARYRIGAYRFWCHHAAVLLTAAGHPAPRAEILAEALLAPLAAEALTAQLDAGREPADIADTLAWQARRVASGV